jgi:hypothetical protein
LDDKVERLEKVYGWGEAFVRFAITNSTTKDLIVCPCKKCGLNRSLWPEEIYDHLTDGSGIWLVTLNGFGMERRLGLLYLIEYL